MDDFNLNEFEKIIGQIINQQNNIGIDDFEGYSPQEMDYLMYNIFDSNSPVKIKKLPSDASYNRIPLFALTKHLVNIIKESGELKLTQRGYLPPKVVKELFDKKYLTVTYDMFLTDRKVIRELEVIYIHLAKILLLLSGIVKKRKNKISLTKKGQSIIADNHEFFLTLLNNFIYKFNWPYFDRFSSPIIGQIGVGYSLYLVSKYGNIARTVEFYWEKYLTAFPSVFEEPVIDDPDLWWFDPRRDAIHCYTTRFFNRFLKFLGLVKIIQPKNSRNFESIIKLPVFDKLIEVVPPQRKIKVDEN